MKKLITLSAILFVGLCYGQEIKQKIKTEVEIDGHISKKDSLFWQATYFDVIIRDHKTGIEYKGKKCDKKDCKTLHLTVKNTGSFTTGSSQLLPYILTPNSYLLE